jgi:hypothetical protein
MDPDEQARLRRLHEQIEQEPDAEQLQKIAQRYHQWVTTLPSEQRMELMDLDPVERIKRVQTLLGWQRDEHARRLPPQDTKVVADWLRDYVREIEKRNPALAKESRLPQPRQVPDIPPQQRELWRVFSQWQGTPQGRGPLTDKDLADLRSRLSEEGRRKLEGRSTLEQTGLVRHWVRQVLASWLVGAGKGASEDQLMHFFEHELTDAQREGLLGLPPEEMQRKLHDWYYAPREGLAGAPRDFGPLGPRKPPADPGHQHRGKRRDGPPGPPPPGGPGNPPPPPPPEPR